MAILGVMFLRAFYYVSLFLLLTSGSDNCLALAPLASADKHKFLPGSLVRGHVASVKYRAEIKIDEVLYGDASLVGRSFSVQTSSPKSLESRVVSPILVVGENVVFPVWEGHESYLGSDGLKHIKSESYIDYDPDSYAGKWPLREVGLETYKKAPAMAAVLKRLEASKDWPDFNSTLDRILKNEKDSYLAAWEKSLWQSCQPITN